MPRDHLAELRSQITDLMGKFWGYDSRSNASLIVPDALRDHVEAVQTSPLPEKIADELVEKLDAVDKQLTELGSDESGSLPLIARIRPRGHLEDVWTARPSQTHPWPIVLIHGTGDTPGAFQEMGFELRTAGWAVFAPGYGQRATRPIQESAKDVGAYIDAVLAVTGAKKVIIVGHSQGGLVARYWMRFHGGAAKVHHLVCLATPNHGTTLGGVISPLIRTRLAEGIVDSLVKSWFGPAGFQQVVGSPIIEALNDGGDLDEEVEGYTCIATRSDSVIQPPETCFLKGERVRNLWVQDVEPNIVVLHEDLPGDKRVRRLVAATLRNVAAELAAGS